MGEIRPTDAEILAGRLKAIEVRYVFGIPSGQILQQLFRPLTNRSTRRGACRADLPRHRGGLPHGTSGFAGDALVFRGGSPQVPAAGQRPPSVSADAGDLADGREPAGGARRCLRRDRTAEGGRDPAVVADSAALSRPERRYEVEGEYEQAGEFHLAIRRRLCR